MQPTQTAPALIWGLPFACVLLSVALLPMVAPRFWHRRMGLVMGAWVLALLIPMAALQSPRAAGLLAWHAILDEYLPFVTLLLALFTVGGGILLRGGPWGTPAGNTLLLAIGTALAGIMGTTGAAMTLIHPLLHANAHRTKRVHLVVFFILLVANAGGATTPLGDPPLFIGFLRGVPFFWPLLHLYEPLLLMAALLLAAFYVIDRRLAARDPVPDPPERFHLRGLVNVALLVVVIATVLVTGVWRPGDVTLWHVAIGRERLASMAVLLAVTAVSVAVTPKKVRAGNLFNWDPMAEVGKLFAAIFVTIAPVLAMLHAGLSGPLAGLLRLTVDAHGVERPPAIFWLTGVLSAFLDNAPTYLVFFELSGGDPATLTGALNHVLSAIAAGAVFFGALTYIGNAPNLMVRSIASHRGVRMPGFFGYMAWSCALLLPVLALETWLFF